MVRRKIIVESIVRSKKPGFAKAGGIATGRACAAYRQWCVCRQLLGRERMTGLDAIMPRCGSKRLRRLFLLGPIRPR
jgi:hypothetical protein